jgi:hypothetical protein
LGLFNKETHEIKIELIGDALQKEKYNKLIQQKKQILLNTDYTQLADVFVNKPKLKRIYREYREYIRNTKITLEMSNLMFFNIPDFEAWIKIKNYYKDLDYEG